MKNRPSNSKPPGFSLLELMIVLVIAGILAVVGGFMLNSASSKLKGVAFRMRGDISMARSEAVNRNQAVLVEFLPGGQDAYNICVDLDNDDDCDGADTMIKSVTMRSEVQFYDAAGVNGGLNVEADADGGVWTANTDKDGIRIGNDTDAAPGDNGNNFFTMLANGTVLPNQGGTVYIYVPEPGAPTNFQAAPVAIDVNSSGSVNLQRWSENDVAWGTK